MSFPQTSIDDKKKLHFDDVKCKISININKNSIKTFSLPIFFTLMFTSLHLNVLETCYVTEIATLIREKKLMIHYILILKTSCIYHRRERL